LVNRWVLFGKSEDPHKSRAIQKAPLDTKVFPLNDKVEDKGKKKKKLASQDAIPMKAKSIAIEPNTINFREASSTSYNVPETSNTKSKSFETIILASYPTTVGNSKFRVSKNKNNIQAYLEVGRRTKQMKTLPSRIILNQVLPVRKGFSRTKYFERTFRKEGTTSFGLHSKMVLVDSNPLVKRVPFCISYQTLNVEALIQKSPTLAKVG